MTAIRDRVCKLLCACRSCYRKTCPKCRSFTVRFTALVHKKVIHRDCYFVALRVFFYCVLFVNIISAVIVANVCLSYCSLKLIKLNIGNIYIVVCSCGNYVAGFITPLKRNVEEALIIIIHWILSIKIECNTLCTLIINGFKSNIITG